MNFENVLLHLTLIEGLGPATIERLVAAFIDAKLDFGDLGTVYEFKKEDFIHYFKLNELVAQKVVAGLSSKFVLDKELKLLNAHGISWITIYDKLYPELLKATHLPPVGLYVSGYMDAFTNRMISIVGSRNADRYGNNVVRQFVPELVSNDWTIVSGGALGIDSMAHQAALDARGLTVAVLGSGLLMPFPTSNKGLFKSIVDNGGAVISSFGLTMPAVSGNFPARNRIISGLSRGCLVVQAAERSGALITARFALEQGREVMAVPGSIDNPLSVGCHKLINEGAALVTQPQDISVILDGVSSIAQKKTAKVEVQQAIFDSNRFSIDLAGERSICQKNSGSSDQEILTIHEKLMYFLAKPTPFDELLIKMNIPAMALQELLLDAQIDGKVNQNFMGHWHSA